MKAKQVELISENVTRQMQEYHEESFLEVNTPQFEIILQNITQICR